MTNTKKVVHITTVHHPLDPRIYYKECQTLQKVGYDVSLIVPLEYEMSDKSAVTIIPIKKYHNKFKRMLFSTFEAYQAARKQKADYYHIHDPELLFVAWLLKKKGNVVIYDIHEDYETSMMQKEYIPRPLRKFMAKTYKLVEKALSRKLQLCLAEKYYQEKYPTGKCILNYPLLNSKLINHKLGDKPLEDKLIYTGNISLERGAQIHARLPLIDEKISVHFYGKCSKNLADQMNEIAGDRKNQLKIEGVDQYVPKQIIDESYTSRRWLAGIALFPLTDHYKKKELTKFFEYMSAGIPIVCSDFPAWKEFVEKHSCGIAVNPNDDNEIKSALEFLRRNPNDAIEMGNNGRKAVSDALNWEIEGKKLVEWYREIWANEIGLS
ncbi:glycosyl transferase [Anaerobacillus alkalidiazotrophicus]|uniref:Glycosyl transferase n=1 Tax=Anaerobacillus alkalidiazotrophicus TaxID=472963 RepID=A0A1S2MDJ6_9BACI|nr:glycosyltransferase [Anaerobacillus alkalidiazotrophicus]OIJ21755.1 glycosyl transferase [Anaerobacillus alkalidiazotrophicus]